MIAAMAQWEREEISSRIAASVPIRARLGKHIGGEATFGYRWKDGELKVDEKEAPIRRLVYELFLTHKRKKTVAKLLNDMGHRMRSRKPFTDMTIRLLLTNSTAKGVRLANYVSDKKGKDKRELKPESEWILVECPAIVPAALWDECNRILQEQTRKRTTTGRKAVHLLSGYVSCACGKKMYVFHRDMNYACKACNRKIAVSDIDEIYLEHLKDYLLTEVDQSSYLEQAEDRIGEREKILSTAQSEAEDLRKKAAEMVKMRVGGEMSRESFMEHHGPLEERLKQLSNRIPELEADISFMRVQADSSETVLQEAKMLYQRWPLMTFEEKRDIVERITEAVIIDEQDITIKLAYEPSALQNAGKEQTVL